MTPPRTSVVIPAYRGDRTLPLVLAALRPQIEGRSREVVLVDSTGDREAELLTREWPWIRVVGLGKRALPGRARNHGVRVAHGELLAFLDADAVPAADWLDQLEAAQRVDTDLVAGAVVNGTPDSPWGTAAHALEFLDWRPDRVDSVPHAVTCNLLVSRTAFVNAGGFPEDMWPGEDTVFTFGFGSAGRLGFAPEARVAHLNRTGWREVLRHQRRLGASYVKLCARVPFPGGWLARPPLAPLAVLGRVFCLAVHGRRQPALARQLVRAAPRLAVALVAWGVGVAWPPPAP